MNRARDREGLLSELGQVSFMMDELRLYLDTHSQCREALSLFARCRKTREELWAACLHAGVPLGSYDGAQASAGWDWNMGPMPWEMGGED